LPCRSTRFSLAGLSNLGYWICYLALPDWGMQFAPPIFNWSVARN
jgi:hypothetical protein